MKKYLVTYHECYSGQYEVTAKDRDLAAQMVLDDIFEGRIPAPENCYDSGTKIEVLEINENTLEDDWDNICHNIPTYELTNQLGLDTGTAYILDLTTTENYNIANEFLKENCSSYSPIDKNWIGQNVIMEMDSNGGANGWWYMIHGTIDEYFTAAKRNLENVYKKYIRE